MRRKVERRRSRALVLRERIHQAILVIRGHRVILDSVIAALYGVETRVLVQAVRRNTGRFPADFMFQLDQKEFLNLKSQFVISSSWGGRRRSRPYAFTEQGVAMLSSVLHSDRAVRVNIEIMRAFVSLRNMVRSYEELSHRLDELEKRYDAGFADVFAAIRQLMAPRPLKRREIGFRN